MLGQHSPPTHPHPTPQAEPANAADASRLPEQGVIHGVTIFHKAQTDHSLYPDADLRSRLAATLIDVTFLAALLRLVQMPLAMFDLAHQLADAQLWWLRIVLTAFTVSAYTLVPVCRHGQTVGKRALGLRVVSRRYGTSLRLGQVLLREGPAKVISLGSGSVLASLLISERPRLLHDYLCNTRVIAYRNKR